MISQTVEYSMRAMSHLASLGGHAATADVIARTTRIPRGYVSKIMRDLVRADLVRSHRGPRGGFILAREPQAISLLDIVNAVDPIRRVQRCPVDNPLHDRLCTIHQCLDDVLAQIEKAFRTTTLGAVARGEGRCSGQCLRTAPTNGLNGSIAESDSGGAGEAA